MSDEQPAAKSEKLTAEEAKEVTKAIGEVERKEAEEKAAQP